MYSNVLFSLPENTRLALKEPALGFFEQTRSLKRTISVMHSPEGSGAEILATNIIGFHLGSPIKLKRSVLGARFIMGEVSDTERLSQCSFYIDVEKEVKRSTDRYLASRDLLKGGKSSFFKSIASTNLCQEVLLPSSDQFYESSMGTVVDHQRRLDQVSEMTRRYAVSDPSTITLPNLSNEGGETHDYRDWTITAGPALEADHQADIYRAMVGAVDIRSLYYTRNGVRTEPSTREAARSHYAEYAESIRQMSNRDGFARRMLERTMPRAARALSVGERVHNDMYDALVQSMGGDYDGDAAYVTATIPAQDRRPHLPQNQRNRGPVPRNQRW